MNEGKKEDRETLREGSRQDLEGMRRKWIYLLPLLLYSTLLFFVSGMSQPPTPNFGFDWQDKLEHAGAFFLMALLAYWAASKLFPGRKLSTLLLITVGFASLYGATDEIHQYFVPERTSDIFDWIADTVGALLAVPVILRLKAKGGRRKKE